MGKGLFVTGTGTDIGKTYVTGLIVKKLRAAGLCAGYYKAALSGAEPDADGVLQPGDALYVNTVAGLGEKTENLVSYVYREAVSPHLAAKINNRPIDFAKVEADYLCALSNYEYLTMEGSGGIICPLRWDNEQHVVLDDLIKKLNLGVLIIADAGLGTINATVLTIEYLRNRQIPIKGIMLNNYIPHDGMQEDNAYMIEEMTGVHIWAKIEKGATELAMNVMDLKMLYE